MLRYTFFFLIFIGIQSLFAQETVIISGVIKDYSALNSKKKENKISVTVTDPYKIVYTPVIDGKGRFMLSFHKYFTQDISLQFNEIQPVRMIVSPGDRQSYVIDPDVSTTIVKVSGSNAATNQNMIDFQKAKEAEWLKVYAHKKDPYFLSEHRILLLELAEIFNSESKFLEAYIKTHKVTELFKQWSEVNVRYDYASRKTRIAGNSHQPVADLEFYKQFPIDERAALMTSNFIPYFNTVMLYEHFFNSYVNSYNVQELPAFISERLVREYKKCLPKGIYMKYLEEEFRSM